jgi:hypothetical protein
VFTRISHDQLADSRRTLYRLIDKYSLAEGTGSTGEKVTVLAVEPPRNKPSGTDNRITTSEST